MITIIRYHAGEGVATARVLDVDSVVAYLSRHECTETRHRVEVGITSFYSPDGHTSCDVYALQPVQMEVRRQLSLIAA